MDFIVNEVMDGNMNSTINAGKHEKLNAKKDYLNGKFIKTVEENKDAMFRLAYSIVLNQQDAEDIVSEAVLKGYSHLEDLKNAKKMKAWLFQILVNESKACLKKRSRMDLVEDSSLFEDNGDNKENNYDLLEFVCRLDDIYKEVVILYYFEDFNVKEIANILDISEGTIKSRLSRARAKLKEFLENDNKWKG
ncbi:MAG: RNA polymerase sigma factor [Lachnospiraceae bacterium]|nr:RNA polymerase sigma factor [Lachnospiraceae bacterium]